MTVTHLYQIVMALWFAELWLTIHWHPDLTQGMDI